MNTVTKLFFNSFLILILISSCNDNKQTSAFDNILLKEPFNALTDSIKLDNKNPDLYYRRSVLLQKDKYTEAANADLQKAWDLTGKEDYAFALSNLLLEDKPVAAEKFITDALRKIPNSIFLKLNLVRAQNAQNKTDAALQTCTELLQKEPAMIDAWLLKAELQEKKGDESGALLSLENAYTLAPFDVELSYELAFKYAQNKNSKIISLADSLIKMDASSSHAEPYYFKGVYFYNNNEKTKALQYFSEAILHNHNFLDAYLEKGRILFEQKKYREALSVFQLATQVSITFADGYYWMGKCQEALNMKKEAKENYNRAYGLDNTLTEAKEAADKIN